MARRRFGRRGGRWRELGTGGGDQRGAGGGVQPEGVGQQADGLRAGAGAVAALQVADPLRAETGPLGQLLLAQAGGQPAAAQQRAEAGRGEFDHAAPLGAG